jgi:glyoxylase-like metal-dependent hydrolase (beta-lactamase superfamily II)
MHDKVHNQSRSARGAHRRHWRSATLLVWLTLAAGLAYLVPGRTRAAEAAQPMLNQPAVGTEVDLYAPGSRAYAHDQGDGQIHPWHAQGNVWLMAGEPGGSNVAVQVGNDGVLVVDAGTGAMAPKLLAQIRQLAQEHAGTQKAIRFVLNTNGLTDHIGGNEVLRKSGSTIVGGNELFDNPGLAPGATVIAHQNVLDRLVAENTAGNGHAPQKLWPTDTEAFDLYNMYFNGEAVQLYHPHAASTDGQLMILFRRSDVIAAGDVLDMDSYPIIDVARGGTIDGELVALNELMQMAVPAAKQEGGTLIIPGHGRLCDQSDVVHYKNMMTIIRNRVQYYKNQGKTLQQVLALGLSGDYDQLWGATSGPWTTQDFITAIFRTLPPKGPVFSMLNTTLVPSPATVPGTRIPGFRLY